MRLFTCIMLLMFVLEFGICLSDLVTKNLPKRTQLGLTITVVLDIGMVIWAIVLLV